MSVSHTCYLSTYGKVYMGHPNNLMWCRAYCEGTLGSGPGDPSGSLIHGFWFSGSMQPRSVSPAVLGLVVRCTLLNQGENRKAGSPPFQGFWVKLKFQNTCFDEESPSRPTKNLWEDPMLTARSHVDSPPSWSITSWLCTLVPFTSWLYPS